MRTMLWPLWMGLVTCQGSWRSSDPTPIVRDLLWGFPSLLFCAYFLQEPRTQPDSESTTSLFPKNYSCGWPSWYRQRDSVEGPDTAPSLPRKNRNETTKRRGNLYFQEGTRRRPSFHGIGGRRNIWSHFARRARPRS